MYSTKNWRKILCGYTLQKCLSFIENLYQEFNIREKLYVQRYVQQNNINAEGTKKNNSVGYITVKFADETVIPNWHSEEMLSELNR